MTANIIKPGIINCIESIPFICPIRGPINDPKITKQRDIVTAMEQCLQPYSHKSSYFFFSKCIKTPKNFLSTHL